VWTTAERYAGLLLNFILIVVLSRLLTPAEIGIIQLGWIVMRLTDAFRDFGIGSYLVQKRDLDTGVRLAFTLASPLLRGSRGRFICLRRIDRGFLRRA
jgi:O-antigen/teichoic acid export membrane protein